jgi:type I restriction enzyme S subunit
VSTLPSGWAEARLGDVVEFVRGVTYKKQQASDRPGPGLVPLVRATNVQSELVLDGEFVFVPKSVVRPEQFLQIGDIIVASSSGSISVVGKSAVLRRQWWGGFGAFCTVLRPKPGIDPAYVGEYVASPVVRGRWSSLAAGTSINNLKRQHFEETVVPVAPIEEQRRIVAVIEEQFSRLDAGVALLQRATRNLKRMRSAVLWAAFAAAWPTEHLVDVTDPHRPICYGILKPRTTGDLVIPYVEVRSIRGGQIDGSVLHRTTQKLHDEFRRSELRADDVVLAIRGSFDRAAVVPAELDGANVSRDVARIAPAAALEPTFLAYYLGGPHAYDYFSRAARGVGVRGVNISDLRQMPVPIPSLARQRDTVAEIDRSLSVITAMSMEIDAALRRSVALRRAMLGQAFSGQLAAQDSSDEPAAILLERIAFARESEPKVSRRRRKVPA